MVFNSIPFAIFFATVLAIYWSLRRSIPAQNATLVLASWYFYATWSWKFLSFLISISALGYLFGLLLSDRVRRTQRLALVVGLLLIAVSLLVVKYYNFIVTTFNGLSTAIGAGVSLTSLQFLMPVGISYYTFANIGYIVDIYRNDVPAERDPLTYFAYVGFFPHLLSGPIASAKSILPQFSTTRTLTSARIEQACAQFMWGLFKKVVIADTLGMQVNYVFYNHASLPGSVLLVGIILYSFQVYCDFSGYSDMARGLGRLLGIELAQNFKMPYLSRDVGEFWRRWHTSLSLWMKDYVYIPLGGRSPRRSRYIFNLLVTFTFSGLWHGPYWTFVIWGFLNGLYLVPYILANRLQHHPHVAGHGRVFPSAQEFSGILSTFLLVTFSRVFFRAPTIDVAYQYFGGMFSASLWTLPHFATTSLLWIAGLMVTEWIQREREHTLEISRLPLVFRLGIYAAVVVLTSKLGASTQGSEYLYFKF